MSKRTVFVTLAALFALSAVTLGPKIVWMDPFVLGIHCIAITIYFVVPAAFIAGLCLLFAVITRRSRRPPLIALGAMLSLACLAGLAMLANDLVHEHAVTVAKAYPAQVGPLLEAYRQTHGAYPANLDQLSSKPPLPRLMRGFGYQSDGQNYFFLFPQPGGLIDVWSYDSRTGSWQLST